MARHHDTGKKGESLGRSWLQTQGYEVLEQNWRHSHYEIDLLAAKEGVLHIVEVKTRRNDRYGYPEESVSPKKFESLSLAAEAWLEQHPGWQRIQYDILSVTLSPGAPPEILLIEDVFYW